jgi:simple sugar transport system permease protein
VKRDRKQKILAGLVPLTAIFLGILIASLLIAMTKVSPFEAFGVLISSGFGVSGKVWPLLITFAQSTPLILNGLAAMMGFRVGVFSIAQEGQYVFGAIAAAWMGTALNLPPALLFPLIFAVSMLVGGLYSLVPG